MKWIEVFHGNRSEAVEPSKIETEAFQSDPQSDPKCNGMHFGGGSHSASLESLERFP